MDDILPLKDLRAPSIPHLRAQKSSQKYLSYLSTPKGALGQPFHSLSPSPSPTSSPLLWPFNSPVSFSMADPLLQNQHSLLLQDPSFDIKHEVRTWTRRDMYHQRMWDISPIRPPHHYGRCRGCHERRGLKKRRERRREVGWEMGVGDGGMGTEGMRWFFEVLDAEAEDLRLVEWWRGEGRGQEEEEEEEEEEGETSDDGGGDGVEDDAADGLDGRVVSGEWILLAVTDADCDSGGASDDDWQMV
ncbi:MAG: hypothetical protein Q9160_007106 [Pyrenula sp. 1 TL-2023]